MKVGSKKMEGVLLTKAHQALTGWIRLALKRVKQQALELEKQVVLEWGMKQTVSLVEIT